jgi:hypothetical protein
MTISAQKATLANNIRVMVHAPHDEPPERARSRHRFTYKREMRRRLQREPIFVYRVNASHDAPHSPSHDQGIARERVATMDNVLVCRETFMINTFQFFLTLNSQLFFPVIVCITPRFQHFHARKITVFVCIVALHKNVAVWLTFMQTGLHTIHNSLQTFNHW